MNLFSDDPVRGFFIYIIGTLVICYLARLIYRRQSQKAGSASTLSKSLYVITLLVSPYLAYRLINIDETYGYYRYLKTACDRDGGDYIAERLARIDSIAVHPVGGAVLHGNDILDFALYYSRDEIGQNFSFIEFQFDVDILKDAESADGFFGNAIPQQLTLAGKPVEAGYYRAENLCRSSVPNAWKVMGQHCFRVQKVAALKSPYLVEHKMASCERYSNLFRICTMRWELTRRQHNTLMARAVGYAYAGGWRTQMTYQNDQKLHSYPNVFKHCGSEFLARGLLKKISQKGNK